MFTLKFFEYEEYGAGEPTSIVSVSCQTYAAHLNHAGYYTISCYPKMTLTDGVDFNLPPESMRVDGNSNYDCCFVENIAGKTIANYKAPKDLDNGNIERE